jgi:hypothetical protein
MRQVAKAVAETRAPNQFEKYSRTRSFEPPVVVNMQTVQTPTAEIQTRRSVQFRSIISLLARVSLSFLRK